MMMFTAIYLQLLAITYAAAYTLTDAKTVPLEAVFQGTCENNGICEHLCYNLHDGTFECDCRSEFVVAANGYSCIKRNLSLHDKLLDVSEEKLFGSYLDGEKPHSNKDELSKSLKEEHLRFAKLNDFTDEKSPFLKLSLDYNDKVAYEFDRNRKRSQNYEPIIQIETLTADNNEEENEADSSYDYELPTSPGPNLEQKLPSALPNPDATESLATQCLMECGKGRCLINKRNIMRCSCPLGSSRDLCKSGSPVEIARFHGSSWAAFAPLREAYRDVQFTVEFNPKSKWAVLLVSGENDDLSGDFVAAVLIDGYVEFRWDCGSGPGKARSADQVQLNAWNIVTVYRHRWGVWLQLNTGTHVHGRSKGLFSRITFQQPLYVGGAYNLTSLSERLGTTIGFEGCIRKLQINDHIYRFSRFKTAYNAVSYLEYNAIDGWDITECAIALCDSVECLHGGECVSLITSKDSSYPMSSSKFDATSDSGGSKTPFCVCPLGYTGVLCEKQFNIEVPSFNGSSLLIFPPLGTDVLSMLEIEIVFKPVIMEGVLLFASNRTDGRSDFIALILSEAHVLFVIDLGSGSLTLRSIYPIRPNTWHKVLISRTARRTWMHVDDQQPVDGASPGAFTMLSLSQPLFLGGLPQFTLPPLTLLEQRNFVGCIQKLLLNSEQMELISGAISGSNVLSCAHLCSDRPCQNGGICIPVGSSYVCKCAQKYVGRHCSSRIFDQILVPSFNGKSFLKYTDQQIIKRLCGETLHLWFRFRSTTPNGLLMWIGSHILEETNEINPQSRRSAGDSLSLMLQEGKLLFTYNLGSGSVSLLHNGSSTLNDGLWHSVKLSRIGREAHLSIDENEPQTIVSTGHLTQLNVDSPLYIGGRDRFSWTGTEIPGLTGCIADLVLSTDYPVNLVNESSAGQSIDSC